MGYTGLVELLQETGNIIMFFLDKKKKQLRFK